MSLTPPTSGDESREPDRQHEYHLPDWFMAENVKTKTQHRTGIRLLRNVAALGKRVKCSPHADPSGINCETEGHQSEAVDEYEFQAHQYTELRDLAAAALLSNNMFPGEKKCAVGPCMAVETGSPACATALIEHLAKDMGATCISVGSEELYKLARDFHRQDHIAKHLKGCSCGVDSVRKDAIKQTTPLGETLRGWDSKSESGGSDEIDEPAASDANDSDIKYAMLEDIVCMVKYQFAAIQSLRCQCSIKTIVDAHLANAPEQPSSPHNCQMFLTQGSPVIIHLRDLDEIYSISKKIPGNFRNVVLDRWNRNEPVLLIASEGGYYSRSELKIGSSLTVEFQMSQKQKIACKTENDHIECVRSIRKLKKLIRNRLPKDFASELLSDATPMQIPDSLVMSALSFYGDYDRIANQILGRACMKGILQLSDIHDILMRANPTSQEEQKPLKDELLEAKELSVSRKLERIKRDCTEYELQLFECVVDSETQKVTYDDVILEQNVKDHMRHLVHMSRIRFEGSSKLLLENTRVTGALLYGPPGTGKTHLARAVANDSKATMIAITPAEIESKWVGDTEKAINAAFTLAKKLAPCVLFIDEVDAMFYRRSSDDKPWTRRALTQFLQEMDGLCTGEDTPFVLGATNRPMDLDEAFLRRLPKKVMFGLPGEEERLQILQIFLKEPDLDSKVNLKALARKTVGMSGSDLRSLCGQAALQFAMDEGLSRTDDKIKTPVKLQLKAKHFIEALRTVQPSVSKRSQENIEAFNRLFNSSYSKKARSDDDEEDHEVAFL